CPISVGAVDAAIMRMSAALHDPWTGLRDAVRHADAVYADETSWRLQGQTQWLWVAASALLACYRIDPSRSRKAAQALLGEDFGSFVVTDRYAGYHWLDVLQQQLCWAHHGNSRVMRPVGWGCCVVVAGRAEVGRIITVAQGSRGGRRAVGSGRVCCPAVWSSPVRAL
ncbi:MAG: transposase, partial [Actinobacteria bacterium]|nr:transposase [Actinomycetota bacterium]